MMKKILYAPLIFLSIFSQAESSSLLSLCCLCSGDNSYQSKNDDFLEYNTFYDVDDIKDTTKYVFRKSTGHKKKELEAINIISEKNVKKLDPSPPTEAESFVRLDTPEEYLKRTEDMRRVLVVGGGKTFCHYPLNYFLFTLDPTAFPHLVGDISAEEFPLYEHFKNSPFDLIILEHLDKSVIVKKQTLINIKSILKKGGKLITNRLDDAFPRKSYKEKEEFTPLYEGLSYLESGITKSLFPFAIYYNENTLYFNEDISRVSFDKLVKPFFQENGFEKIKIIKNSFKEKTCFKEETLLRMIKK